MLRWIENELKGRSLLTDKKICFRTAKKLLECLDDDLIVNFHFYGNQGIDSSTISLSKLPLGKYINEELPARGRYVVYDGKENLKYYIQLEQYIEKKAESRKLDISFTLPMSDPQRSKLAAILPSIINSRVVTNRKIYKLQIL